MSDFRQRANAIRPHCDEAMRSGTVSVGFVGNVGDTPRRTEELIALEDEFSVKEIYDEELQGWTVSVTEIDLYGEGATKEEAISDLIASIREYISLYTESNFLTKHEIPEKQALIVKLMLCENDEAIRNLLKVNSA
jgi:hypothetical protein